VNLAKGASVLALKTRYYDTPHTSAWVRKRDELEVLHVYKDARIKVKNLHADRAGSVFIIPISDVEGPLRPLGVAPEGAIAADDPRIDWIWEDAERVANISGFCHEYDRLLKMMHLPGRLRTHTVKMASADGIEIVARVKARSLRQAEERLRQQMNAHAVGGVSIEGADLEAVTAK
jgi:hypothetical protein